MTGNLIDQKFNLSNRGNLWKLRECYGKLEHAYSDPLGRLQSVIAEHADRLITAGKNVYVDVPIDDCDPNATRIDDSPSIDPVLNKVEDDLEQARRLA